MNNKLFMGVLIAVLIAAVGVGGAFAGGVAYGKSQDQVSTSVLATPDLPSPAGTQAQFRGDQSSSNNIAELRSRFQSGDAAPEDLEQLRRQFA
ncbi:MAG: hypothetical protein IIC24_11660, partial [Chloroflexi bacterium]|nr:hypothetical protein [Chloroflexota bacterium]